jgi:hypothetical protein
VAQRLFGFCYPELGWFLRRDYNFIVQDLRIFTILPLFREKSLRSLNFRASLTIAIIRIKLP